jgi:hypothetical protein
MSVAAHTHISGLSGFLSALYVIVILGILLGTAKYFEGVPAADAFVGIFN